MNVYDWSSEQYIVGDAVGISVGLDVGSEVVGVTEGTADGIFVGLSFRCLHNIRMIHMTIFYIQVSLGRKPVSIRLLPKCIVCSQKIFVDC